jgi:hypothetical protein
LTENKIQDGQDTKDSFFDQGRKSGGMQRRIK